MADYMPRPDSAFGDWAHNLATYIEAHAEEMGFTPGDIAPILDAKADWDSAHAGHITAQAAAESARIAKDQRRRDLAYAIRPFVKRVQASPSVTDEMRRAMGVSVSNNSRHAPIGPPEDRPLGMVEAPNPGSHIIRFVNEPSAGVRRAKPTGVMGCEVWVKIGGIPRGPSEYSFVGTVTRSPYEVRHSAEDSGKTAHYILRWVGTRGQPGPWSPPFSAMIWGWGESEAEEMREAA
jgi:hypothetical protein